MGLNPPPRGYGSSEPNMATQLTNAIKSLAYNVGWLAFLAFIVCVILLNIGNNIKELTRVLKDSQKQSQFVPVQTCTGTQPVERGEEAPP